MSPTDVEIDRILNAIASTLNDQRAVQPPVARLQEIADGATGRERRLDVRGEAPGRFTLHEPATGTPVATVERSGAQTWTVRRELEAQGSHVAQPEGGG